MPVSILELALHRGAKELDGGVNGAEFDRVGLAILGGCEVCGASLAAYNAYPSRSGYWRCADDIYDDGWDDVAQADKDIFAPELAGEVTLGELVDDYELYGIEFVLDADDQR